MNSNLEHFPDCWINQRAHKTRCGCVVYSHCSGRLDRCFTVILLLGGQVALPPIAVTEVALSGISRYYNISDDTTNRLRVVPAEIRAPPTDGKRFSPEGVVGFN